MKENETEVPLAYDETVYFSVLFFIFFSALRNRLKHKLYVQFKVGAIVWRSIHSLRDDRFPIPYFWGMLVQLADESLKKKSTAEITGI